MLAGIAKRVPRAPLIYQAVQPPRRTSQYACSSPGTLALYQLVCLVQSQPPSPACQLVRLLQARTPFTLPTSRHTFPRPGTLDQKGLQLFTYLSNVLYTLGQDNIQSNLNDISYIGLRAKTSRLLLRAILRKGKYSIDRQNRVSLVAFLQQLGKQCQDECYYRRPCLLSVIGFYKQYNGFYLFYRQGIGHLLSQSYQRVSYLDLLQLNRIYYNLFLYSYVLADRGQVQGIDLPCLYTLFSYIKYYLDLRRATRQVRLCLIGDVLQYIAGLLRYVAYFGFALGLFIEIDKVSSVVSSYVLVELQLVKYNV